MKKLLSIGFLMMGFTFTVTQGLVIRELMVSFFGNELSIGLILGNWLILEALGSGPLGKLANRWGDKPASFAILQILFALFLPICLYAIYSIRSIVGAIPGEGIGLVPIFWSSFLVLIPIALIDGAMFAFGCKCFARLTESKAPSIGRVYVYEAAGAIVGGIVFTYLFIPFLYTLQIVLVLFMLNVFLASVIFISSYQRGGGLLPFIPAYVILFLIILIGFIVILHPDMDRFQRWLTRRQWEGFDVVYAENSMYGNVAVIRRESQYTFFSDGIPILTSPMPDVVFNEEIVHLPMLFIPNPQNALVISGGLGGVISELEKYPLNKVDYAELDPLIIEAIQQFPTTLTLSELADPRLLLERVDGRLLVRKRVMNSTNTYDLVILNLPYPTTLQLNRFYTVEFFKLVNDLLAEDGVLVIGWPGSLSYMSDELRNLNLMLLQTLREVFPKVKPIPGDFTLWMASPTNEFGALSIEEVIGRWENRGIDTRLMTTAHILLRLDQRYLDWFWDSLSSDIDRKKPFINEDLHPLGLYYGLSYWHAMFSPEIRSVFEAFGKVNLGFLSLIIVGTFLVFLGVMRRTGKGKVLVVPIAIMTTGFSGMMADLVMIFAFQSLYGFVFSWIGLFITAFMIGLGLAGALMTHKMKQITDHWGVLIKIELGLVLYWVVVLIALNFLYDNIMQPFLFTSTQWILLGLNVSGGFLVGSQFPLANKILEEEKGERKGSIGALYASDLIGAFLGSVLVSVVLIPILGILMTCLFVAILKLSSLLLVTALRSRF
jgi:spermidine synthase